MNDVRVSRELLRSALGAVEYLALRGDDIGTSNVPVADALRALIAQPATAEVDEHKMNIVLDKVYDICENFEMEDQHTHPTYKQFKRLHYELARAKLNGGQS